MCYDLLRFSLCSRICWLKCGDEILFTGFLLMHGCCIPIPKTPPCFQIWLDLLAVSFGCLCLAVSLAISTRSAPLAASWLWLYHLLDSPFSADPKLRVLGWFGKHLRLIPPRLLSSTRGEEAKDGKASFFSLRLQSPLLRGLRS